MSGLRSPCGGRPGQLSRTLDGSFQLDIIVEEALVPEIRSVLQVHPLHQAQLMTFLRISGVNLGLLLNFNAVLLKDRITHVLNSTAPRQT
jgi:GxxExxY protein